jgi:hypothetical protein
MTIFCIYNIQDVSEFGHTPGLASKTGYHYANRYLKFILFFTLLAASWDQKSNLEYVKLYMLAIFLPGACYLSFLRTEMLHLQMEVIKGKR